MVAPELPCPRIYAAVSAMGDLVTVHGGCEAVSATGEPAPGAPGLADHFEFDLGTSEWQPVESRGRAPALVGVAVGSFGQLTGGVPGHNAPPAAAGHAPTCWGHTTTLHQNTVALIGADHSDAPCIPTFHVVQGGWSTLRVTAGKSYAGYLKRYGGIRQGSARASSRSHAHFVLGGRRPQARAHDGAAGPVVVAAGRRRPGRRDGRGRGARRHAGRSGATAGGGGGR